MKRKNLSPTIQITFDPTSKLISANNANKTAIYVTGTLEIYSKITLKSIDFTAPSINAQPAVFADGLHFHPVCGPILVLKQGLLKQISTSGEQNLKVKFERFKPIGPLKKVEYLVGFSMSRKVCEICPEGLGMAGLAFVSSSDVGTEM